MDSLQEAFIHPPEHVYYYYYYFGLLKETPTDWTDSA